MNSITEAPGISILIVINTLIFLVVSRNRDLFYSLLLHPYRVFRREHVTGVFLSGFLHKNLGHLAVNMAVLYVFGSSLEVRWTAAGHNGVVLVWVTYMLCILISNAISVIYNRNKIDFTVCGSSAAVVGILFCYIRQEPMEVNNYIPFLSVPNIVLIPFFMVAILLAHFFRKEKIDHLGHLTGLLAGQLIFFML